MSTVVPAIDKEEQAIYHIDCDKHYTPGGAPPILVLRKESSKPPILILQGTQTFPPRTPVVRDERKDKRQSYILKDERKPLNNHPATFPFIATSPLNYGENSYSAYQQQSMMSAPPMNDQQTSPVYPMSQSQDHSTFGSPSNLSYSNNPMSTPWMGSFSNYQMANDMVNDTGRYTQQEPYYWQQPDPWTYSHPPPDSWHPNDDYANGMYPMEQMPNNSQLYYSPWTVPFDNRIQPQESAYQWNTPLDHQPPYDTGRQPAFRVVPGRSRRSKSVSFAPLPDHVATL